MHPRVLKDGVPMELQPKVWTSRLHYSASSQLFPVYNSHCGFGLFWWILRFLDSLSPLFVLNDWSSLHKEDRVYEKNYKVKTYILEHAYRRETETEAEEGNERRRGKEEERGRKIGRDGLVELTGFYVQEGCVMWSGNYCYFCPYNGKSRYNFCKKRWCFGQEHEN